MYIEENTGVVKREREKEREHELGEEGSVHIHFNYYQLRAMNAYNM